VYGRVSRYRLDEYLQLFDFPSPNLSSERRFTTNVPLQRLFFMNSDFMQQQGELLARRLESETDPTAKLRKAYRLIFGRDPSGVEVRAGLDYLRAEPMREYEEKKHAQDTKDRKGAKDTKKADESDNADAGDAEAEPAADGMMAGVVPGAGKSDSKQKLLPVTPWGRYLKVLLSSSEFLFVS
ncbi:MAG TPA: DUF1553 domain-containing protein, partial [Vicinamibacterales bacterium]|nr:DUF1553 domain-containing protein [Vicinamibacterales bacterium]